MLHLPEHISRVYRRRRDGLRDGLACSTCRRSRSNSSGRHMRTCVLPKRVEYFSANLVTMHTASIADHNALLNSLLAWIRDRVRIKCACTSKLADLHHCVSMQNITCPICRTRLIKSTLDRAAVNAARRHILRAWRSERQILNGDQLRSTDFGQHYG
jgi:hypothetical protein